MSKKSISDEIDAFAVRNDKLKEYLDLPEIPSATNPSTVLSGMTANKILKGGGLSGDNTSKMNTYMEARTISKDELEEDEEEWIPDASLPKKRLKKRKVSGDSDGYSSGGSSVGSTKSVDFRFRVKDAPQIKRFKTIARALEQLESDLCTAVSILFPAFADKTPDYIIGYWTPERCIKAKLQYEADNISIANSDVHIYMLKRHQDLMRLSTRIVDAHKEMAKLIEGMKQNHVYQSRRDEERIAELALEREKNILECERLASLITIKDTPEADNIVTRVSKFFSWS